MLINENTWQFIRKHANDDVRKLALQGSKEADTDLPMALQQIAGRQTARRKLPTWSAVEDLVYPPHLNMEQCSSEQTARYKQQLVERLLTGEHKVTATDQADGGHKGTFIDLTGGFGVDFYFMSQGFKERIYVEQNAELCALVKHNFALLNHPCAIHCLDTATFLSTLEGQADVIYLDPARRNEHGGRTYGIEDCSPNVQELLPVLLKSARFIVIKLSPMLDWRKAVSDLKHVAEVHIVSVGNECKELLLVLNHEQTERPLITCVNDESTFRVVPSTDTNLVLTSHEVQEGTSSAMNYLYEPNASIMKAGCFAEVEQQYAAVRQLSANSHLFTSAVEIDDFPGRRFQILSISSMNKQELKSALQTIERANITVRNFPLTVEQLRKKLKLKDGGDIYLFATTASKSDHKLFICRKIG
ncbi:MAG: SAM-dependent methyltransferase [Bacteroidaceae bacterium]|nr:SAM-dependent methyltransferase [Bacteroidaceae bacterium]